MGLLPHLRRPGIFPPPRQSADAAIPVDRLLGQPCAGESNHRPAPGEVFVHRNVANIVQETDFNVLAVLQYAVDVLKVKHIIICGHYGCGGVRAALDNDRHGLIDNWLAGLRSLHRRHQAELDALPHEVAVNRLCELNVMSQAQHVARTTIVQDAWQRDQPLAVHSWIYSLDNGRIHPLTNSMTNRDDLQNFP